MLHYYSHSVTSSLQHHQFSVVQGKRNLDSPETGGTGKLERKRREGEQWRGNTDRFRENVKTEMQSTQLAVTQQSSASITVQCCSEPLLPGGPGTTQFKQTLPAWVQCCALVIKCSCAVWGVKRKGIAVSLIFWSFPTLAQCCLSALTCLLHLT